MTDYERIKTAIEFISTHFQQQPELEEVAKHVYMSPFHFQRMFKNWAGVSPKKFLQYISIQHAKKLLLQKNNMADTAFETGLSTTSRLHDLFVTIEGMTPGEYKNGGEQLSINYSFAETAFGKIIVASTKKGICHLAFTDNDEESLQNLIDRFPNASFKQVVDKMQQNALFIFKQDWKDLSRIKLHLKGTDFQLKVWEALLKIPMGGLCSYSFVAESLNKPRASRAVGSAIGDNPVAFLIPCHRVIKSNGEIGEYHWTNTRKKALIGWESSRSYGEAS